MVFHFSMNKLAHDHYDATILHLFFLLPHRCLTLPPYGEVIGHKEMRIQPKHFLINNWGNLQKESFLRT
jgi:hypothetical protein